MTDAKAPRMLLDDYQVCIPRVLAGHARTLANKPAVVCDDEVRSWHGFDAAMSRVANALLARGIGRGCKVAVLMDNAILTLELMLGIVRAGACLVPLSALLTPDQLRTLLTDSQSEALFCSGAHRHKIEACRRDLPGIGPERFFATDFQAPGWQDCAALMATASDRFPDAAYAQDDPFNIIYSSGTTGLPKGIVQTHRARLHWAFSNAIDMRFHVNARGLTSTPLYSNGTWLTVLPALFAGATLHVMRKFEPHAMLDLIERHRITHTFAVPTQLILALDEQRRARRDLSSLESLLCAGSTLRPDIRRQVLSELTPALFCMYGFSEGFATVCKPHQQADKGESVGLPVLGFEVMIVDDQGRELPAGETGEIAGYGAGLMRAYHNREDATAALVVRDAYGRSFVRSGDIGRLDADGYLYVVDRKKDLIISGGFNIFPVDIEAVVGAHPDVLDVSVIALPDEKWGEVPMALVIPRHDAAPAQAIREWANARLAKHQRISRLEMVDDLPRNALGKVLKRVLRERYGAGPAAANAHA
jgi:long-chain acyl-CoA synthetase